MTTEADSKQYVFKPVNNIWQFYGQFEKELSSLPHWRKAKSDTEKFDLLIADRGYVKWNSLEPGQSVNYYRGHLEITNKASMAIALRSYFTENNIVDQPVPLTFVIWPQPKDAERWVEDALTESLASPSPAPSVASVPEEKTDTAEDAPPVPAEPITSPLSSPTSQSTPKTPAPGKLTRKPSAVRLARVKSFVTSIKKDDEREQFKAAHAALQAEGAIWIAKSTQGAKGDNICVSRDLDTVLKHVDDDFEGLKTQNWVVQRYLERPFLIHGRKFDIRAWVLIDSQYRIYLYKDAVCRLSSEAFKLGDLENRFIHLTNHCIQTGHPNYGDIVEGNEMFFGAFDKYLQEHHGKTIEKDLKPQMAAAINHSLLSIKERMFPTPGYNSFQLFGYDFMIDADFKCFLIEINATPASAERLLENMVKDTIEVVLNPVYPPSVAQAPRENLFELIHDPATSKSAVSS